MINLIEYQDIEEEVRVELTNNEYIVGHIISVDDEEESGFDEMGITIYADGGYIGLAQSDIISISKTK